jgi:hypothetical protein
MLGAISGNLLPYAAAWNIGTSLIWLQQHQRMASKTGFTRDAAGRGAGDRLDRRRDAQSLSVERRLSAASRGGLVLPQHVRVGIISTYRSAARLAGAFEAGRRGSPEEEENIGCICAEAQEAAPARL